MWFLLYDYINKHMFLRGSLLTAFIFTAPKQSLKVSETSKPPASRTEAEHKRDLSH
jgi:hypothetical protein